MTRTRLLIAVGLVVLATGVRAANEAAPEAAEPPFLGGGLAPAEVPAADPVPALARENSLPPSPGVSPAATAAADAGDDPAVQEEAEAESAEMDEVRAAEEKAAIVPAPATEAKPPGAQPPRIALLPEIDHDLEKLEAEYDIPIDVNEAVRAYIRFFQTEPARKHFVKWLGRLSRYDEHYRTILKAGGLPEDTLFLAMIESGFANLAYSRARAVGPWQFIAGTAKRMGLKQDFWVDERRDPEKAAIAAAAYLKELYDQFGDWRLAWAGYNAGAGKIDRAQKKGQQDFWAMARGRVLKRETKGYVPKLMAAAIISKHQEAFGFRKEEVEPEAWPDYEVVLVPEAADLSALAGAAGATVEQLRDLNPELRRSCTPPRDYELKVPRGSAEAFAKNWPAAAGSARLSFAHHVVAKGDSLGAIASAYGVPVSTVVNMNGLKVGRRVRPGTELVIPLSAQSRKSGQAPASQAVARARIEEIQKSKPELVEHEPPPREAPAARVEQVDGRTRATVLVQAGDSLWAIAQKFGVGLDELCRWNGIRNPRRHKLQIGSAIVVFPRGMPPAASAALGPG
ncbi:MAG TPA: LysM peptidoglycan-binding domain-containing protein [Anaeromyxobacteraceae bacterium]|nr:LysM peptidoglycan-binding domain-containing protein [Anaeromyxobacteraceae bacterium]